ncbi:unnamed protein product [Didymodactylos carnosus]|uniref:Receptor expression-enhancing protein n=1 Tax=Didymodactylos carnosus TaxID=1234261 RepID=A0A814C6T3_9BILA|nr:unnamed protein product [Didymodactylos carnosus]CAF0936010.1 unnamed protein product [Didymodactylos carnosus]CAF3576802.1 unnamed protein product [Didymodactylos carnosus]CAF3713213.1 unnamed protein product [Didymodactylos carnosus]
MIISFVTYRFLSIIIGILLPSYKTYKAIKYQLSEQYLTLLCYWIVFSFYHLYEIFLDQILSLIFPFYYEIKLLIIYWLACKNGAQILFNRFLLPYVTKHEQDIDYIFNHTINRFIPKLCELSLKTIVTTSQIVFNRSNGTVASTSLTKYCSIPNTEPITGERSTDLISRVKKIIDNQNNLLEDYQQHHGDEKILLKTYLNENRTAKKPSKEFHITNFAEQQHNYIHRRHSSTVKNR